LSKTIAIGDIHGCVNTLIDLIEQKLHLTKSDSLFLLGDYVNKGPDSKGVIDYILAMKKEGYQVTCLRGNHDQLMINAWKNPEAFREFLSRGGDTTLRSFGAKKLQDVPSTYYSFLSSTAFFSELNSYILIHAGFDFQSDNIFPDFDVMLNIREMEVDLLKTNGKRIIHGHVPVPLKELTSKIETPWKEISIDTGCVYVDQPGKGYLTAMILENRELISVKNKDS